MVRDAVRRTISAADITGIRALMVHALDEKAFAFYRHIGFLPSPGQPLTIPRDSGDAEDVRDIGCPAAAYMGC
ncbi:MAG: hypothetical protein JJV98_12565 [Desulfosarcina sp.]|nr:hypothetical protein [Desulfobacterales bacterium]